MRTINFVVMLAMWKLGCKEVVMDKGTLSLWLWPYELRVELPFPLNCNSGSFNMES